MTRRTLQFSLAGLLVISAISGSFAQALSGLGNLPLYFTEQAPSDGHAQFLASSRDSRVLIAPANVQLNLRNQAAVQVQMVGARSQATIHGEAELAGKINYLNGSGLTQWRTAVPTFAQVRVENLYPGISAVYHGNQDHLEYDFQVAPGTSPAVINLRFTGADKLAVNEQGGLDIAVGTSEIHQPKPVIYQTVAGARHEIAGGFRRVDEHTVAFNVGRYDAQQPLVIDPILNYSTYFGGTAGDSASAVAVNTNDGSIFIAGQTLSSKLAATGGPFSTTNAFQKTFRGGTVYGDAFVAKFDSNFNLIYLTYLGGSSEDEAVALAVDKAGNAFVGGFTDSTDFPVTNQISGLTGVPGLANHIGGVPQSKNGPYPFDGFVAELSPDGSRLVYSTYFGGGGEDTILALALDIADNVYVTGYTLSTNLPATNAISFQLSGTNSPRYLNYLACPYTYYTANAFVAKIASQGTNLDFCSYFGGTNLDVGTGIAVDSANNVYVCGYTASTNFPNTNAFQPFLNDSTNLTTTFDGFVAKLAPTPTNYHLLYSTYLGNTNLDQAQAIAVDNSGAYVTGFTTSTNFYNTATNLIPNGVTNNVNGIIYTTNVFLTKITNNPVNSTLTNLAGIAYSAVFGGLYIDTGNGVAVDSQGDAFVTGSTLASAYPFPATNGFGLLRTNTPGWFDVFVTAFNPTCTKILYSVILGGTYYDYGYGIAVDQYSSAYVVGQTLSANFPVTAAVTNFPTANAWSTNLSGSSDAFLAKIQLNFAQNLALSTLLKTNTFALSWLFSTNIDPTMAQYALQTSTNLASTNWMNLTNGLTLTNSVYRLTLPATNPYQFFRLHNTNSPN